MPLLALETTIRAPLAKVWAFHDDPIVGVPALSPPKVRVKVESADTPVREGSRIIFTAKGPLEWIADKIFVARQMRAMLRYRHDATKRLLEQ